MTPYEKASELVRKARTDLKTFNNSMMEVGSVSDLTNAVRKAARLLGRQRGFEWIQLRVEREGTLNKSRIDYVYDDKRNTQLYAESLFRDSHNASFQTVKEIIGMAENAKGFCEAIDEWKMTPQYHVGSQS